MEFLVGDIYIGKYLSFHCQNSPQRELLLKTFSETECDDMYTEDVYRFVKGLGVTNPSQLRKELTAPEKGSPVLIKIREKYYRAYSFRMNKSTILIVAISQVVARKLVRTTVFL